MTPHERSIATRQKKAPSEDRSFFVPTEEQHNRVWAAVAMGMTVDEIAVAIINPRTKRSINSKTLRKYFPDAVATAAALFKTEICVTQVNAMRKNKTNSTAIFLSKVRLGLRERMEITGKDGGPIDFKSLTDEQLDAFIARGTAALGRGGQDRKAA